MNPGTVVYFTQKRQGNFTSVVCAEIVKPVKRHTTKMVREEYRLKVIWTTRRRKIQDKNQVTVKYLRNHYISILQSQITQHGFSESELNEKFKELYSITYDDLVNPAIETEPGLKATTMMVRLCRQNKGMTPEEKFEMLVDDERFPTHLYSEECLKILVECN